MSCMDVDMDMDLQSMCRYLLGPTAPLPLWSARPSLRQGSAAASAGSSDGEGGGGGERDGEGSASVRDKVSDETRPRQVTQVQSKVK